MTGETQVIEPLSKIDAQEFETCRRIIHRGLANFIEVGGALCKIKAKQLYRESHRSFEDFCLTEFEISRSHAYRLIESSEVVRHLSEVGEVDVLPANESQARVLATIHDPMRRVNVWKKALKAVPQGSHPTSKVIQSVVGTNGNGNGNGNGRKVRALKRKVPEPPSSSAPSSDELIEFLQSVRSKLEIGDIDSAVTMIDEFRSDIS